MNDSSVATVLDRHQQRREQGVPVISVLAGVPGVALGAGRRWAASRGRRMVEVDETGLDRMAEAWTEGSDPAADALSWLAGRLRRPPAELGAWLGRMTSLEKDAFLESVVGSGRAGSPGEACRWLLMRSAASETAAAPGLVRQLAAALAEREGRGAVEEAVAVLDALRPDGAAPVLIAAGRGGGPVGPAWVEAASASLARLAGAAPGLILGMAVDPESLAAYLGSAVETRARALVRAGVVAVSGRADGADIVGRLAAALPEAAEPLAGAARRLAADGASDELIDLFIEAAGARARARAGPDRDPLSGEDPARSAAERFLFERLESLPETTGLFALNARLDIPFGPGRAMEVDLLARSLGLAVEIDGYYHFREPDAYRRDRRKDLELQKRGYLVVRVLADDVVPRLEHVLDQILGAVATRRSPERPPPFP